MRRDERQQQLLHSPISTGGPCQRVAAEGRASGRPRLKDRPSREAEKRCEWFNAAEKSRRVVKRFDCRQPAPQVLWRLGRRSRTATTRPTHPRVERRKHAAGFRGHGSHRDGRRKGSRSVLAMISSSDSALGERIGRE